jgi:hypothetical protein
MTQWEDRQFFSTSKHFLTNIKTINKSNNTNPCFFTFVIYY